MLSYQVLVGRLLTLGAHRQKLECYQCMRRFGTSMLINRGKPSWSKHLLNCGIRVASQLAVSLGACNEPPIIELFHHPTPNGECCFHWKLFALLRLRLHLESAFLLLAGCYTDSLVYTHYPRLARLLERTCTSWRVPGIRHHWTEISEWRCYWMSC